VRVKASCGDEACTARAKGKVTEVKHDKLGLGPSSTRDVAPGETVGLLLGLTKKTRKEAGKALDDGKNVEAKVTVRATDAAGNVATEKRTIRLAVAHLWGGARPLAPSSRNDPGAEAVRLNGRAASAALLVTGRGK
jgi:hypothetical protein